MNASRNLADVLQVSSVQISCDVNATLGRSLLSIVVSRLMHRRYARCVLHLPCRDILENNVRRGLTGRRGCILTEYHTD